MNCYGILLRQLSLLMRKIRDRIFNNRKQTYISSAKPPTTSLSVRRKNPDINLPNLCTKARRPHVLIFNWPSYLDRDRRRSSETPSTEVILLTEQFDQLEIATSAFAASTEYSEVPLRPIQTTRQHVTCEVCCQPTIQLNRSGDSCPFPLQGRWTSLSDLGHSSLTS